MNERQWGAFTKLVDLNGRIEAAEKINPLGNVALELEYHALHDATPWLYAFESAAANVSRAMKDGVQVFESAKLSVFRTLVDLNRQFTLAESNGSSLDALEQKLGALYAEHSWLTPFGPAAEEIADQIVHNHDALLRDAQKGALLRIFTQAAP